MSFFMKPTKDQAPQASHCMVDENLENEPSSLPEDCIRIPRPPASYLTGQVWRWEHLDTTATKLEHLPFCLSGEDHMEICVNPNHYKSTNPLMMPQFEQPWASLAYHEKYRRVGNLFQCQTPIIQVQSTGIHATDRACFDLGKLPEPEEPLTAHTRQQIGNGIQIIYLNNQVFIESKSDLDVFVQARLYNCMEGYHKNTVFRLLPQRSDIIPVMRDDDFDNYLSKQIEKGMDAVFEMANLCSIRIVFAETWDGETPITEMNCWMKIKLKRHLSWMDTVLQQIGAPYRLHS